VTDDDSHVVSGSNSVSTQRPNVPDDQPQSDFSIVDEEYPVDRLRSRMNERLAGRPLTVYLVLFAGAATLLLLLGVVWISWSTRIDRPKA
jgi:hypothetical protein